jgi:hypothetical protein
LVAWEGLTKRATDIPAATARVATDLPKPDAPPVTTITPSVSMELAKDILVFDDVTPNSAVLIFYFGLIFIFDLTNIPLLCCSDLRTMRANHAAIDHSIHHHHLHSIHKHL